MSELINLPDDIQKTIALEPGEKILWHGHPSSYGRIRTSIIWRMPNALIFVGVFLFSCHSAIYFKTSDITLKDNNLLIRLLIFALGGVLLLMGLRQLRSIVSSFRTPEKIRYLVTTKKVVVDETATFGALRTWPVAKAEYPQFSYFADGTCDVTLVEEWTNDGDGAGIDRCVFFAVQDSEGLRHALISTRTL